MSLLWGKNFGPDVIEDSLRSHEGKQGWGGTPVQADADATSPAALSQNPLDSLGGQRLSRCERPGAVFESRPDFARRRKLLDDLARAEYDEGIYSTVPKDRHGFWDYVYWAGWGVVGMACLVLAASVAKAIRYGVVADIINWIFN